MHSFPRHKILNLPPPYTIYHTNLLGSWPRPSTADAVILPDRGAQHLARRFNAYHHGICASHGLADILRFPTTQSPATWLQRKYTEEEARPRAPTTPAT